MSVTRLVALGAICALITTGGAQARADLAEKQLDSLAPLSLQSPAANGGLTDLQEFKNVRENAWSNVAGVTSHETSKHQLIAAAPQSRSLGRSLIWRQVIRPKIRNTRRPVYRYPVYAYPVYGYPTIQYQIYRGSPGYPYVNFYTQPYYPGYPGFYGGGVYYYWR